MDPCRNVPFLGVSDPFAAASHLVGFLAADGVVAPLWKRSSGSAWRRTTVVVFAASMLLVYAASTAYHTVGSEPAKGILRRFDHASIYVLIAGTFTPIVGNLATARFRAWVLATVWAAAVCGVLLKTCFFGATSEAVDTSLYLAMGWFGVVPSVPILKTRSLGAAAFIAGGAGFYTLGALSELFGWPILVPGVFGFHEVFHLFSMAASACFFGFVLRYVVPVSPACLDVVEPLPVLA
ncbi:hemolysin III family protein [bacterium]|nr:hemolysin III family protein [bacterium]